MEMILAAAIRHDGIVYSVPKPGRHHNVIRIMNRRGMGPETMREQGFLTNTGRFVDRKEACLIARAADQIMLKTEPVGLLFSEDVW